MIAYYKRLWGKHIANPVVTPGTGLAYIEDIFSASRTLGEVRYHVSHSVKAGIVPLKFKGSLWPNEIDDLRLVPEDAQGEIENFDKAIAKLQAQRIAFINDNFRTWAIPTKDDCQIVKGRSKEAAQAEVTQHNTSPTSLRQAKSEKAMVRRLNQALTKI